MSRSLLLHVGLPKTATTSLQFWAQANRGALAAHGIDYPDASGEAFVPKHQFLVNELMAGGLERTRRTVAQSDADRLFLSTEGLTNHLYDFPDEGLARFRDIVAGRRLTVFAVVREPDAWVRSYYKQAVLNPPMPRYHYATSLTLPEFARLERVRRLADHEAVMRDAARAYAAAEVVAARFEADWLGALREALGSPPDAGFRPMERRHESLPDDLIELFRQVNALALPPALRQQFLGLMQRAVSSTHSILMRAGREALAQPDLAGLQHVLAELQRGNGGSEARTAALARARDVLHALAPVAS